MTCPKCGGFGLQGVYSKECLNCGFAWDWRRMMPGDYSAPRVFRDDKARFTPVKLVKVS